MLHVYLQCQAKAAGWARLWPPIDGDLTKVVENGEGVTILDRMLSDTDTSVDDEQSPLFNMMYIPSPTHARVKFMTVELDRDMALLYMWMTMMKVTGAPNDRDMYVVTDSQVILLKITDALLHANEHPKGIQALYIIGT